MVNQIQANYFDPKSAAERYATGRPYFHPLVIDRIKAYLSLTAPVSRAIDVGCGTGLSTVALKEIARHVVGVDKSAEMVARAPADPHIEYYVAPAEELPVHNADFDLMTLGSVFHWLDRTACLTEARRVLRPRGWLVVYDNYFSAQMEENPEYLSWTRAVFLKRYPSPPRSPVSFGAEDSERGGFQLLGQEQYQNFVKFTVGTLVNYLVTQSNIIAAVEGSGEDIDDVRRWLAEEVKSFFGERAESTFMFRGPIWYLRNHDDSA